MNQLQAFVGAIRDQSLGISLGYPWRYDKGSVTCVVPIIRVEAEPKERGYLLLSEADKLTVLDGGNINRVQVVNAEDVPVFIRMGEILKGGTQSRAVTFSQVVMPGEKRELSVVCVHASRPIMSGTVLDSAGYVPNREAFFSMQNMSPNVAFTDQAASWSADREYGGEVRSYLAQADPIQADLDRMGHGAGIGTVSHPGTGFPDLPLEDDITSARDTAQKVLDDVLKGVPLFDNQIGVVLIDRRSFYLLDCYDLAASWKVVKEAMVGKECLAIADRDDDSVFLYRPENVHGVIKKVLGQGFSEKDLYAGNGQTLTIGLEFDTFIGEAVILDERVIHLMVVRKEE